eukprot:1894545-Prymnesium_polylepis.2
MEAVKQGSAAIGLRSNKFAIVATLKRSSSELSSYQKKIFVIDDNMGIAIAGAHAPQTRTPVTALAPPPPVCRLLPSPAPTSTAEKSRPCASSRAPVRGRAHGRDGRRDAPIARCGGPRKREAH